MAAKKRLLTWFWAFSALTTVFIACGSSVPSRPAALDPSNPDGPESPRMTSREKPSAPMALASAANADVAAPAASTTPTPQDSHHPQQSGTAGSTAKADAGAPSAPSSSDTQAVYTCPMHPEVTSDRPGNCPKCGMKLVLKAKAVAPQAAAPAHGTMAGTTPAPAAASK